MVNQTLFEMVRREWSKIPVVSTAITAAIGLAVTVILRHFGIILKKGVRKVQGKSDPVKEPPPPGQGVSPDWPEDWMAATYRVDAIHDGVQIPPGHAIALFRNGVLQKTLNRPEYDSDAVKRICRENEIPPGEHALQYRTSQLKLNCGIQRIKPRSLPADRSVQLSLDLVIRVNAEKPGGLMALRDEKYAITRERIESSLRDSLGLCAARLAEKLTLEELKQAGGSALAADIASWSANVGLAAPETSPPRYTSYLERTTDSSARDQAMARCRRVLVEMHAAEVIDRSGMEIMVRREEKECENASAVSLIGEMDDAQLRRYLADNNPYVQTFPEQQRVFDSVRKEADDPALRGRICDSLDRWRLRILPFRVELKTLAGYEPLGSHRTLTLVANEVQPKPAGAIVLRIHSPLDGHLHLLNIGTKGEIVLLYPNDKERGCQIDRTSLVYVPGQGAGYTIRQEADTFGTEIVYALVLPEPLDLSRLPAAVHAGFYRQWSAQQSELLIEQMGHQIRDPWGIGGLIFTPAR